MILNANEELKNIRTFQEKMSDKITAFAGSMWFVYFHAVWFGFWILINTGAFGLDKEFDKFPFGLLTMVVSLEAIFLSTFVMISQNRQAKFSEIRSELDYRTNKQAEKEIDVMVRILGRIADKQGVAVDDLVTILEETRKVHPLKLHR
jgi:uncharacterized membrane protein